MGVTILGLDAMTWEVVEPLMAAGELPVFRELCGHGAWGTLESTVPAVTPTAWPSMLTGKNPGQHGVWGFRRRNPARGPWEFELVTRFDYEATPLWRLLERFGRRGAFFNVPCAYPLDPQFSAGVLTSGYLTPTTDHEFAYPRELRQRILGRTPGFEFKLSLKKTSDRELVGRGVEIVRAKFDVIRDLRGQGPWDVLFAVIDEPDTIQHALWPAIIRRRPAVLDFYRQLDREIGRLAEDVSRSGDTLLIVSDHGFRSVSALFCINEALEQAGYLEFRQRRWPRLVRARMGDLVRRIPGGSCAIEQYRRLVPRHRVRAGEPVSLTARFRSIRAAGMPGGVCSTIYVEHQDPALADRVHGDLARILVGYPDVTLRRGKELYHGPHVGRMPALLVTSRGRMCLTAERHGSVTRRVPLQGEHSEIGILVAVGHGIRPGAGLALHIYDVLPTVLHLLGLPIPDDLDGKVATGLLARTDSPRLCDARTGALLGPPMEGDSPVRQRLRGLGLDRAGSG
jgi:predicted AlkP superfamily phosphohydrolase/phosphomutase